MVFLALKNATHRFSCGQLAGLKIFGKKSFQILPNAIDINKYRFSPTFREEIRKEFHLAEDQKVVGMIGILNLFKNQSFLIEVAKELPDVTFFFVGEGPDRSILEEKSKELKNIIVTGKREDVHKFYSAFDIFAFPSLFEGFPIVLVEAQCSGVNIIMNETIDPTTQIVGELCTALPLDKAKWVDYIEKVPFKEKKRQMNEHLKRFDIEENIQNLKEIYKQGLKRE